MKKLQSIVYLILLSGFIMGYMQGFDTNEKNSDACVSYYNEKENSYNQQLYWMQDGLCCRYALIDNMIQQECQQKGD